MRSRPRNNQGWPSLPATRLGAYEILLLIGSGGVAEGIG